MMDLHREVKSERSCLCWMDAENVFFWWQRSTATIEKAFKRHFSSSYVSFAGKIVKLNAL